jgi:DNA-binding transcriptional MerR regulator
MEEDMIMNVPSAPEMQGTPMTPELSMEMQSEMGDMTQNEIQEAQGALMQILQVINMLIEQGLNPEQIKAFLEQYGISEEELEQAAQALGVDIDMVLSGQMQAPQEPMMMAEGGPAKNVSDRTQSEQLGYSSFRLAVLNPERADSDMIKKDYLESVGPEIYAMDEANILAGREPSEFLERGIQNFGQFSQNPITVAPSVMRGTDFDEAGNPIVVTSPSTQNDTNMPNFQDSGIAVDTSEIPAPSVTINVDYLNFMQPNGVLDEQSYGDAIQRAKEMEQSVQELLMNYEKAIQAAKGNEKENLIKNLEEYVSSIRQPNMTIFTPSLVEKKN